MRRRISVYHIVVVVSLVVMWCVLWGEATIANVASGLVVAVIASNVGAGSRASGGVHIVPLLRFTRVVAVDLVVSTVTVMWEVITPTDYTEESIVAVRLPPESRSHLLLLVVVITLTPGTAVVDADPDTGTLYLHLLHDRLRQSTIEHVERIAVLACQALPVHESAATAEEAAR